MPPASITSPGLSPGSCSLEEVMATHLLHQRPARTPGYAAENRALVALAGQMAEHPHSLLQRLVETTLELCAAESAGISIEETDEEGCRFRWRATAGKMAPYVGGTMLRHFSPCCVAIEQGQTVLMRDPARHYGYISDLNIPVREVLLVPFYRSQKAVGTVWIVSHESSRDFDAEDARVVESLSKFASAAFENLNLQIQSRQTRDELQQATTKLEAALQAGAIATWNWDIINDKVQMDKACAALFGLSEEEAGGSTIAACLHAIHPEDRPRVQESIEKAVDAAEQWEAEYRLTQGPGYRWVIARGRVLRDSQGRSSHFPGVIVDVSEERQMQIVMEERQRTLWAGLPVACYTLDGAGRINFFNEAAARLWGRRPVLNQEYWCGAHALMTLDGKPIPLEAGPASIAFHSRKTVTGLELHIVRPDGSRRWVTPHAEPVFDSGGEFAGLINVLYDVTEERVASTALREARDQAVAASRAKDDFLAALSHELRTPLNPVLLVASDAARNSKYPAEARADFESVLRNVELEARLIDDLLDVTRISHGKLTLQRSSTDLHTVLMEAASKVETEAREKDIRLCWNLDTAQAQVNADPVRLQQVFWNVLKNAVKFTPEGGDVKISTCLSTDGREVLIQVLDTGIGIRADEIAGIFDAFTQGTGMSVEAGFHLFGGLGLGLAISQQVMRLHEGQITAASEGPGRGACFTIEMPVLSTTAGKPFKGVRKIRKPAVTAQSPDNASPPSALPPAPLVATLIVEDHQASRQSLQRLLCRRGHEVAMAACGQEALDAVTSRRFDLVICDIGLPDTDGYTLIQEIIQRCPEARTIALTGYGTENDVRKAALAGFDGHLTKPVNVAQLEKMIRDCLSLSEDSQRG